MLNYLLFACATSLSTSPLVAAYKSTDFGPGEFVVQMVGFLEGFIREDLYDSDLKYHKCMVDKVDVTKFKSSYNDIMTYIDDNKKLFTYDAKTIALKINDMADGLLNGMRDPACKDDIYWSHINTL